MSAPKKIERLDSETLRQRLKLRSFTSEQALYKKHPTANEFFKKIGLRPSKIREHATRLLSSGALAGTLLLTATSATPAQVAGQLADLSSKVTVSADVQKAIAQKLKEILPPEGQWQLNTDQEEKITDLIWQNYGVHAKAELDGNRLNNDFGRMGAEQHLPRFPGDTAAQHGELVEKGITPGLGGWGYVSDFDVEKYYVAVQTLYLPDWNSRLRYYVDWYRFRRMVAVNPANGKAMVVAIADAGPAQWTGKHFGGSPEVMNYLGIDYGRQNHPVILYFLDDPNHEVPLGPLEYNWDRNKKVLASQT